MSQWVREMKLREKELLAKHATLVQEIKRIPHLKLPISIDLEGLKREANAMELDRAHELHHTSGVPDWYFEHHKNSYRGQCLVDYTESGERGMEDVEGDLYDEPDAQVDEQGRLRYFVTPWGLKMPQSLSTLRQITPYLNRTRLIRTPPQGGIHWHSHHNGVYRIEYLRLAVVILTLETNPECYHGVRDYRSENSQKFFQRYESGTAYLFNAWHEHEFWNKGNSDRLTLISYLNFPDETLLKFLQPLVESYSGPKMDLD